MAQLVIRDLSDDLVQRVRRRVAKDRWLMRPLLVQLLEDYAAGKIGPTVEPAGNPLRDALWPTFGEIWTRLECESTDWFHISDRERGQRLKAAMLDSDARGNRSAR